MRSPAFNPNASYSVPAFDPGGEYHADGGAVTSQASQPQEGFWESLGHTFGIGREEEIAQNKEVREHPLVTALKAAIPGWEAVQGAVQGAASGFMRSTGEAGQAVDALRGGNPAAAGVHAVQALPFVGPAIQHGADQLKPGESINPAEVGTALGTSIQAAPLALGMADGAFPGRPTIPNPVSAVLRGVGTGLRGGGEGLAESALGVRNVDRAFSANPGHAALTETTGFKPSTIASEAQQRLEDLQLERGYLAHAHPGPVDFSPARSVASDAMQEQASRNAIPQVNRMAPLADQILTQGEPRGGWPAGVQPPRPSGSPIPAAVDIREALNLREGVGGYAADKPWTGKASADPLRGMTRGMYGSMSDSIHTAVPEIAPLDARMHDLIPVAQRAGEVDLNASTLQRVAGRFGRPTGALLGAVSGAAGGHAMGGAMGALLGGFSGLIAPEVLADPAFQMSVARSIYSMGKAAETTASLAGKVGDTRIPAGVGMASGTMAPGGNGENSQPAEDLGAPGAYERYVAEQNAAHAAWRAKEQK